MAEMEELVIFGNPEWGSVRRKVEVPLLQQLTHPTYRKPGPKEVLIKVAAVGLNPKDWKYTEDCTKEDGLNAGDDISGVIEAVGSEVLDFKKGDRVAGLHRLGEAHGGYAPFAIVPAATTFHLPPSISHEAGATLPLTCMTAAIALYQALGLPLPTSAGTKEIPVLIYGGSTAVGAFALQLAKLSGLSPIIAVAGAGVDFVRSLDSATHIVDYRSGDAAFIQSEISRALGGKPLLHAFDCAGLRGSWDIAGRALSPGGRLEMVDWGNVLDWDEERDAPGANAWKPPTGVALNFTLVSSSYGDEHDWIKPERADADADFAYFFYRYMTRLLAQGRLKPHPYDILPAGLDGILQGVLDLEAGKVSAKKLIVR